ncbi:MAG: transposase [Pseudomonadota bacterium]|nr:hypothetical protein [Gammaproteobacteria bacterium]MBK83362.1 hypothetical protein [Gammaproteobacteria bacterium]MEC8009644.1 transposase [Pseudomonadota bacterium]|tara:strand:- start:183 stop:1373 length:1191 start_codon:yes stop_codon:yes gene_type:complete
MEDLLNSILTKMSNVNKPQAKAMFLILTAFAYFQGKANFRNLARFCSLAEDTLRSWSKVQFCYQELNSQLMLNSVFNENQEKIAALDASFIRKSGSKTEGVGYFHSGSSGRVERGLEMSLLSVIDLNRNTGFALLAQQTLPSNEEGNRIDQALAHVFQCQAELQRLGVTELVVDAWYSKKRFVDGVLSQGLVVIGKLRGDARLHFKPEVTKSVGRPKKYGQRLNMQDFRRLTKIELENEAFNLHTGVLYSKSLKKEIRIVALRSRKTKKTHALLYSTNINLSAEEILKKYRSRFQIEFIIRDAKQHTGLEDCQARSTRSIEHHFNNSLTALNLLKIEDVLETETTTQKVISIASWRRRKTNKRLAEIIIDKLGVNRKSAKIKEIFEFIRGYGCIAA